LSSSFFLNPTPASTTLSLTQRCLNGWRKTSTG
jgi:hypothetical protein